MYKDKILVVAGCSHSYGTFLTDSDQDSCHARSWVKKLELLAGFKQSINLSIGGASNKRSLRVLTDFVIDNIDSITDYVIMLGLTELSRTEFPSKNFTNIPVDLFFDNNENGYNIFMLGNYLVDIHPMSRENQFLKSYYGLFSVDKYDQHEINLDLFRLHTLLKYYQVEHYFPMLMGPNQSYMRVMAGEPIPYITFNGTDILTNTKKMGFKVGRDINSKFDCNHFDHDGNEFIAKGIYKHMKGFSNGI